MLYVVGDSNSVYTAYHLSGQVDAKSMCRVGWTSEEVLRAVKRKKDLSDARAVFLFVGMNDSLSAEGIALNITSIVHLLRSKLPSPSTPVFVAPPFCVRSAAIPPSLCDDRRGASQLVKEWIFTEQRKSAVILVEDHVTADMFVRKGFETIKSGSSQVDPLHMDAAAYKAIAARVGDSLLCGTKSPAPRAASRRTPRAARAPGASSSPRRTRRTTARSGRRRRRRRR